MEGIVNSSYMGEISKGSKYKEAANVLVDCLYIMWYIIYKTI